MKDFYRKNTVCFLNTKGATPVCRSATYGCRTFLSMTNWGIAGFEKQTSFSKVPIPNKVLHLCICENLHVIRILSNGLDGMFFNYIQLISRIVRKLFYTNLLFNDSCS